METEANKKNGYCSALRQQQMSETPHDLFAEFYRQRIAELQAALLKAQTVEEMEKIQRELDPYLDQIEKDGK